MAVGDVYELDTVFYDVTKNKDKDYLVTFNDFKETGAKYLLELVHNNIKRIYAMIYTDNFEDCMKIKINILDDRKRIKMIKYIGIKYSFFYYYTPFGLINKSFSIPENMINDLLVCNVAHKKNQFDREIEAKSRNHTINFMSPEDKKKERERIEEQQKKQKNKFKKAKKEKYKQREELKNSNKPKTKSNSPNQNISSIVKTNEIQNINFFQRPSIYSSIKNTNMSDITYFSREDILYNIQLVKSTNNHVSRGHNIRDVKAKILFRKDDGKIVVFEVLLHFCEDCKKHFDFYESFKKQLSIHGIKLEKMIANTYDEYMNELHFSVNGLNQHSKLNLVGYSVGRSGLPVNKRHILLKTLIEKNYMSAADIKHHLSFLIRYNGKSSNMENAIRDWQEDIQFINQYLIHF